jgi:hypothetical protein
MSQPQPLQQRVLNVLADQGTVRVSEPGHYLPGIDGISLDCAMNALLRANKVTRALGMYQLVEPLTDRPREKNGRLIAMAELCRPPTAQEETAASLIPTEAASYCLACNQTKPETAFQKSKHGKLYKRCKACYSGLVSAGIQRKREQQQSATSSNPVVSSLQSPRAASPDILGPTVGAAPGSNGHGSGDAESDASGVTREDVGSNPARCPPEDTVLDAIERKRDIVGAKLEAFRQAFEAATGDLRRQFERDTDPLQRELSELDDLELRVKALVREVA